MCSPPSDTENGVESKMFLLFMTCRIFGVNQTDLILFKLVDIQGWKRNSKKVPSLYIMLKVLQQLEGVWMFVLMRSMLLTSAHPLLSEGG